MMSKVGFWHWLFVGLSGRPGWKRLISVWLIFDICFGVGGASFVQTPLNQITTDLILPISGVFFGLAIAWSAAIISISSNDEIIEISKKIPGGVQDIVYPYTLSMLMMIIFVVLSFLLSLDGLAQKIIPVQPGFGFGYLVIFAFLSFTVRLIWSVIIGTGTYAVAIAALKKEKSQP